MPITHQLNETYKYEKFLFAYILLPKVLPFYIKDLLYYKFSRIPWSDKKNLAMVFIISKLLMIKDLLYYQFSWMPWSDKKKPCF